MRDYPVTSKEWLANLVGFPTVSRDSNLDLIHFVAGFLESLNIPSHLTFNDEHTKANLHAVIGPEDVPGVMLSGHSDVVPVDGQAWTANPFELREKNGALYGRGTADMKGFIASVLAHVPAMIAADLVHPVHLAISYDEEVGCIGVRRMIDVLENAPVKPAFCIIGEPTSMQPAIAHKGKTGMICRCHGVEAHSALAPKGLNAIYLANDMISAIRAVQAELMASGASDCGYEVPYSTLHVGTISGGTALNIVPNSCEFRFELRSIAADNPEEIIDRLRAHATEIVGEHKDQFPDAQISIEIFNEYPALDTEPDDPVVAFVKSLTGANGHIKVPFGTEGGLFQQRLGVATVVCGPGNMDQGHKPDEFLTVVQLDQCDRFVQNLITRLESRVF